MKLKFLQPKKAEPVEEISVGYHPKPTVSKGIFLLIFGVLLVSASFYEGITYQRAQDATSTVTTAYQSISPSGNTRTGSFTRSHVLGQVTNVSSGSITVNDEGTGESTMLAIDGNTKIQANGQAIKATDIQLGDLVVITKTSESSTTAAQIIVTQGYVGDSNTAQSNITYFESN